MNLDLIEFNCLAILDQIKKIRELKAELEVMKVSPHYAIFGTNEGQRLDIKVKQAQIHNEELKLRGMLK